MTSRGVLQFDSEALPAGERFRAYAALYADGVDASELGPAFLAQVTAWRLDGITIFARALNDVGHVRASDRAASDGFDHLVLTLVRAGRVEIDSGAGFVLLAQDGGMVADARLPVRNRMRDVRLFTVRVPRERFHEEVGPTARLHGLALPPERASLLVDYVERLTVRADALEPAAIVFAIDALLSLIAGAIGAARGPSRRDAGPRDPARLARVRAAIDRHLAEPELSPARIATLANLSRATLYRLLQPHGGVRRFVQSRRLDLLLTRLSDADAPQPFAEIAKSLGFSGEAQASRAFQHRYGQRPGQYRKEWRAESDPRLPRRAMRLLDDDMR